jgi:hypothetical protein
VGTGRSGPGVMWAAGIVRCDWVLARHICRVAQRNRRNATAATQRALIGATAATQRAFIGATAVCAVVHRCLLPTDCTGLCSAADPFATVSHEPSTVTEGNRLVCLFVCSFVLGAPLSATSEVVQRAVLRVRTRRCNDAKMHHLACFRRHLACSMHSLRLTAPQAGPGQCRAGPVPHWSNALQLPRVRRAAAALQPSALQLQLLHHSGALRCRLPVAIVCCIGLTVAVCGDCDPGCATSQRCAGVHWQARRPPTLRRVL